MRSIVISVIIVLLMFALVYKVEWPRSENAEYWDTSAWMDHDKNICISTGNVFDIEVRVAYHEMDDAIGKWYGGDDIIVLDPKGGVDIDTVAHEVSHMVDTMMDRYDVKDDHFRAYFQGNWTRCVWDIVEKDLIEAGQLKVFKFSS